MQGMAGFSKILTLNLKQALNSHLKDKARIIATAYQILNQSVQYSKGLAFTTHKTHFVKNHLL
jgi:hypothetical protein